MPTFRSNSPNSITHYSDSDITRVNYGIIMHGCNSQGVMGSGVAKQLKARFPDIYDDYRSFIYEYGADALGKVCFTQVNDQLIIASAITQEFYGRDGKKYVSYDALVSCLDEVYTRARKKCWPVHIPYLIGAGLGGGDFDVIEHLIESRAKNWATYLHHYSN